MGLQPGALNQANDWVDRDAMAADIETALIALRLLDGPAETDGDKRKRRLTLIGLSAGIINYLKRHGNDSFSLNGLDSDGKPITGNTNIT